MKRPDIVFVLCDQLRRSALGRGGNPDVETPHIDDLADSGRWFTNAVATYPVCVPARFTMLTGAYPHTRQIPAIDWRLSPVEETIADTLSETGYRTAFIGKWHLAGTHRYTEHDAFTSAGGTDAIARRVNRVPIARAVQGGFEDFLGFELRNHPFDTVYFENGNPEPRRLDGFQTDTLFDLALEYLTRVRDDDRPTFLILSVEAPHPPFTAPSEYLERWRDRDVQWRPNVDLDGDYPIRDTSTYADEPSRRTELGMTDGLADELRAYYAMVENLDDNVGRFLKCLDDRGRREETAFVFTSDHGELMGSHGLVEKQHPYEESVGVPLVVSYPGPVSSATIDTPVSTEDLVPTFRGLAGLDPDPTLPGTDLSVEAASADLSRREAVLMEFVAELRPWMDYADETWRGVRTDRYTYTVKGGPAGGRPWLLFDHEADPYERTNLVEDPDSRGVATECHGCLRRLLVESRDSYGLQPAFGHAGLNYWES